MTIKKTDNTLLIIPTEDTQENFFSEFSKKYLNFVKNNVIIDFSTLKGVKKEIILLFLQYSKKHKDNGMSFVVVVQGIEIDNLPDEITIAPTLLEAYDIIEMEIIEREIGI